MDKRLSEKERPSKKVRLAIADGWDAEFDPSKAYAPGDGVWISRTVADGYRLSLLLIPSEQSVGIAGVRLETGGKPQLLGVSGDLELRVPTETGALERIKLSPERERQAALRALLRRLEESRTGQPEGIGTIMWLLSFSPENVAPRRRGRPKKDDESHRYELAQISAAYATAVAAAAPRSLRRASLQDAVRALLKQADPPPPLPEGDLRNKFSQARAAEMLTRDRQGRFGGQATAHAHELLARHGFSAPWYQPTHTPDWVTVSLIPPATTDEDQHGHFPDARHQARCRCGWTSSVGTGPEVMAEAEQHVTAMIDHSTDLGLRDGEQERDG
jgi:hypothetical protein